jgi:pimeloyl-ACP methyl ester carboxylesterase
LLFQTDIHRTVTLRISKESLAKLTGNRCHRRKGAMSAAEPRAATFPSEEMFVPVSEDLDICFQTFGDPEDEAVLLVMGLGGPMTWWDPAFCQKLADRGFHVIRYDNRDTGRSGRARGRITRRQIVQAAVGRPTRAPYTLVDMAQDGLAVLDHLGHDAAHVVGVSMGGMIAQTMAVRFPDRVRSLTSIMSSTGRRFVGWQDPRLAPMLLARRASREAYIETSGKLWKMIGSPLYPDSTETVQERAAETWDRGVSRSGVARQMIAILTQPDRTLDLRQLDVPTLVIHGLSDKMVHVSGGRATARAVAGAELLLVPGMGHDVPVQLHDEFVDAIARTAARAR